VCILIANARLGYTASVADPDDFWPDPDPDPTFENVRIRIRILTLINFRPTFFWQFFLIKHRFLKYLWLLHTPKKLIQSHLLRPGSGSGSGRLWPKRSGSDRIRIRNTVCSVPLMVPAEAGFADVKFNLRRIGKFSQLCRMLKQDAVRNQIFCLVGRNSCKSSELLF
jgi:hypothetical protein